MCLGGVGGRGIQLVGRGRTWLEFRSGIESFLWPFVLQLESKLWTSCFLSNWVQQGPTGFMIQGECGRYIHSKCETVRLTIQSSCQTVSLTVPSALLIGPSLGRPWTHLFVVWPLPHAQEQQRSLA